MGTAIPAMIPEFSVSPNIAPSWIPFPSETPPFNPKAKIFIEPKSL